MLPPDLATAEHTATPGDPVEIAATDPSLHRPRLDTSFEPIDHAQCVEPPVTSPLPSVSRPPYRIEPPDRTELIDTVAGGSHSQTDEEA